MVSYKESLAKIGITSGTVHYLDFYSRPKSLLQAIRSMDAPKNWEPVSDIHRDEYWTEEVQGVAWDGENWIFSCNANQSKPGANDKAIYVFKNGSPLEDDTWFSRINYKDVPHPIEGYEDLINIWKTMNWDINKAIAGYGHWGQLTYYNGFVYVAHYWESGPNYRKTNVVVFRNDEGILRYEKWIKLEDVSPSDGGEKFYPEFQAINPWDGFLYTGHGGVNTREFYAHYREDTPHGKAGEWTGKVLKFSGGEQKAFALLVPFQPPSIVDLPSKVQGACFSPNGHLYCACDVYLVNNSGYKAIAYFSALNGHLMGIIPVPSEGDQEIEGICFADVPLYGRSAQIYVVHLDNRAAMPDDVYFKSYSADRPDIV